MFLSLADFMDGIAAIPVAGDAIKDGLAAHTRLGALLTEAIGAFDAAGLWDVDDAVSMAGWLRTQGGLSRKDAARMAATARRLRDLPVTRRAYVDGMLTPAQVDTITANVNDQTVSLFAEHEADVVSTLIGLDTPATVIAMKRWKERADALIESPPADDGEQSLHLSRVGDQLVIDATFTGIEAAYVQDAIRVASSNDAEMTPSQRRADALVTICKHYLDHQGTKKGGRHRPHVNIVIDPEGHSALINGTPLNARDTAVVCCDAAFHRVLLDSTSVDLDYGRSTRNISASLYTRVSIRDGGCRFPGCDRTPDACDVHHAHWWDDGGETNPANCLLMCHWHHKRCHDNRWQLKLLPNGELHITKPDGTELSSTPRGG